MNPISKNDRFEDVKRVMWKIFYNMKQINHLFVLIHDLWGKGMGFGNHFLKMFSFVII